MSLSSKVSKAVREIVCDYIMECSVLYNFDGSEAIERLVSNSVNKEVVKNVSKKVVKNVSKKVSWPIPFRKECMNNEWCEGLKYNSGLFTQCGKDKENDLYCKSCCLECEKNGTGMPDAGNISERMKCGLMEFKDPKGRKPTAFLSILKKKKIGVDKVREEAKCMNIVIDEEHFREVRKEKKEKIVKEKKQGRPKKAAKEVESSTVVDLFAELVEEAVSSNVEVENVVIEEKPKKEIISAEEKAIKKSEKEAAKALSKAEKAAGEKQAREEKRAAEKAAKAAEKEAAKAAKEAEKSSNKKGKKPVKKAEQGEAVAEVKAVTAVTAVEDAKPVAAPKVTVTRFEHEGKKYLKSTENILYDPESREELGIWCEESKTIKALPEEDDEEIEEEEYESEDE
jgi:hypothetical protein